MSFASRKSKKPIISSIKKIGRKLKSAGKISMKD
jgi:hypothetical protein